MGKNDVRPFVKPGEPLGFVAPLKERGLWPPRLHDRRDGNGDRRATTPFLVIPATAAPADNGVRPLPNSKAFHSKGVWLEDAGGHAVTTPVVGGEYRIKCRVRNLGAFPAYGGMADFFVNDAAVFTAAAGTGATLPSLGHTGFSLLQGQETVITCPNPWRPANSADLAFGVVVHAYDPFTDKIIHRFDARNDRHVGRHDLAPDLYVRDWTDSAAVHDDGLEPSANSVFYHTSDVWNRRSAAPGGFVNDRPQNQNPQQGNGAAGDNFLFARISRNDAATAQTVKAHFLFAEFGTGSPFVDCSNAPDPSVTLAPGETSAIVSLPWHLHPSSSTHLCVAVQIYADSDPYAPPGLSGNTPGWPTTDMMVINDNNKAQRNIAVWDGLPEAGGMHFGVVFNAATFVRDLTLTLEASDEALRSLKNARVSVPLSDIAQEFRPGESLVLKRMLPGERRWIAFSYDGGALSRTRPTSVYFHERVDGAIVNGFAFDLRATTAADMVPQVLSFQAEIFHRMSAGMGLGSAREGLALCQRLLATRDNAAAYLEALPALARLTINGIKEMSAKFGGVKDPFGITESLGKLQESGARQLSAAVALHDRTLHQIDALQTMAVKSKGDAADILFTVRLQEAVYRAEKLGASQRFAELLKATAEFIRDYPSKARQADNADNYARFVRMLAPSFEATTGLLGQGPVKARYQELTASFGRTPEEMQKAHLNFLNAALLSVTSR